VGLAVAVLEGWVAAAMALAAMGMVEVEAEVMALDCLEQEAC